MSNKVLVTLVDTNHLEHAKQLFASAHFNGGWDGDYMVLAHDIPDEELSWFYQKGIFVKHCNPLDKYNAPKSGWRTILASKLYLFEEGMKKWSKVVYVDTDCLIRASLKRLAQVKTIAGVAFYHSDYSMIFQQEKIKAKDTLITGVFSFDTSLIKPNTFTDLLSILANLHQQLPQGIDQMSHDEIVIRKYFGKKFERLPIIFDIVPLLVCDRYTIIAKEIKGVIVHCASGVPEHKPWCLDSDFYQEWKNNLIRADQININKPLKATKVWSQLEVLAYEFWLKHLGLVRIFYIEVDRLVGKFGLMLKTLSPRSYFLLKRILTKNGHKK